MAGGVFFGIGTGPGDPELMTLKAVRVIKENNVIAFPGRDPESSAAFRTAAMAVPEIYKKQLMPVCMPMTGDAEEAKRCHALEAERISKILDAGENVVYLTLGDPLIYSTYAFLKALIEEMGYKTEAVSAVPSFCDAASGYGKPLSQGDEQIHIIPAAGGNDIDVSLPGTIVVMKPGKRLGEIRDLLSGSGREIYAAENCGMKGEKEYFGAEEIPDRAGYFSIVIARRG